MASDDRLDLKFRAHFMHPDLTKVHAAMWNLHQAIQRTGAAMTELNQELDNALGRMAEDFGRMRELLDDALATETADKARIAELTEQANSLQAEIDQAIGRLRTVDPDPSYPAPAPEADVPQPGTPDEG